MSTASLAAARAPIAMWAVPRSRSTVFLRIMLERGDLEVIHEPFSYLLEDGHFDVGGQRTTSMPELLGTLLDVAIQGRRVFFKDTSDYKYTPLLADERLYHSVINTFMIREPRATVASHYAMNPNVTLDEIGFEYLHSIFEAVRAATDEVPLVIDGDDLVANPEGTVRAYCQRVGLPFIGEALHWKASTAQTTWQRTERWHEDVDRSTGLVAKDEDHAVHPDNNLDLRRLVEHHQPFYDAMYAHRLVVDTLTDGTSVKAG